MYHISGSQLDMARLTLVLLTTAALLASSVYGTPNPSPVAATPLPPAYSILPVLPDSCSRPGGVLCCSEIVAPDSADGQEVMRELGVSASEVDAPIGVKCFSHSPLVSFYSTTQWSLY